MEELFQLLQEKHGLSKEESMSIMSTVVTFVKQKFPMAAGAVDSLFPIGKNDEHSAGDHQDDDSFL
ncbi:MAG: hypothetical protein J5I50_03825 [Chitinophagaceae bacterium]|nr:hypothetical protein [Chitinophagaceae bacterium]